MRALDFTFPTIKFMDLSVFVRGFNYQLSGLLTALKNLNSQIGRFLLGSCAVGILTFLSKIGFSTRICSI